MFLKYKQTPTGFIFQTSSFFYVKNCDFSLSFSLSRPLSRVLDAFPKLTCSFDGVLQALVLFLSPINSQFQMSNKSDVIWPRKRWFVFFPSLTLTKICTCTSDHLWKNTTGNILKKAKNGKLSADKKAAKNSCCRVERALSLTPVSSTVCACLRFGLYNVVFKAEPAGLRAVCTCNTIVHH